jgi:hypothetical protein
MQGGLTNIDIGHPFKMAGGYFIAHGYLLLCQHSPRRRRGATPPATGRTWAGLSLECTPAGSDRQEAEVAGGSVFEEPTVGGVWVMDSCVAVSPSSRCESSNAASFTRARKSINGCSACRTSAQAVSASIHPGRPHVVLSGNRMTVWCGLLPAQRPSTSTSRP